MRRWLISVTFMETESSFSSQCADWLLNLISLIIVTEILDRKSMTQKYRKKLWFTFIRYNSSAKDFSIFNVINQIYQFLQGKGQRRLEFHFQEYALKFSWLYLFLKNEWNHVKVPQTAAFTGSTGCSKICFILNHSRSYRVIS